MKDFLEYILCEVKNKRLTKEDAMNLIRQFRAQNTMLHQNTSDLSEQGVEFDSIDEVQTQECAEAVNEIDGEALTAASVEHLKVLIAEVTKIPVNKLEPEASFEELGLDSIIISTLNKKVEQWVGKLDSTLFYKYNSIQTLGAYFVETYRDAVSALVSKAMQSPPKQNTKQIPTAESIRPPKFSQRSTVGFVPIKHHSPDIAIVGIAGRYPKAETLEQFWKNLYEGKDCIEEIPPNRWSLDGFFEPDRIKAVAKGLSYSKWGGFLDNIDCFDPLFFNISPRDAMYIDPQERLFLEVAWECLEDAGYTRKSLKQDGYGNQIGVFVGATFNNYQLFMAEAALQAKQDMYIATSQMFSIANRVSFVMNFTGPSLTVDTACSSSLYALHLACESIRSGQSRMAIAGGVNLSLHPSKYITLAQGQFSASDGRCRAFCEGGTGYVPSEAVGAIFLKPLQEAINDNDRIYGVIKGTAASHAGKTNGYTVPSPVSQSLAIEKALIQSQIDPESISCIEAHGTGTALGDPIEITGLTDVFRKYTKETGFCSISSVKSNIGHAEGAAGIAQLTKVLLQLKHQTLVKNVMHGERLNPNIDFDSTPFVVQANTESWKRPIINGKEVPRRAGISSFGAGGSNAHVVIEEYIPKTQARPQITADNQVIIVLSAKNEGRLREQVQRLLTAIQQSDLSLADIAYTLQVGREAMEERLAVIVGSIRELEEKLKGFIEGQDTIKDLYKGQLKRNKETVAIFEADEELQEAVVKWIERGKYTKLLNLWANGLNVDWSKLYGDTKPNRISLPTYPFARERYWVPEVVPKSTSSTASASVTTTAIHPLLHQNTSNLSEQRFSSTFTGQEFFLADHVVKGQRVLPGVAYLEMARTAVEQGAGVLGDTQTGIRLKNVVWARPIAVGEQPVQVHIGLFPEDNGEIAYEIYSEPESVDAEPIMHSQGSAVLSTVAKAPTLDLSALQAQCTRGILSSAQCYEAYRSMGIDYGSAHQGVEVVYVGDGQVLAKLSLPSCVSDTGSQFVLHPSLMDSALQASLGIAISTSDTIPSGGIGPIKPSLPFALQELEVLGSCTSTMWALIRYSDGSKAGDKVQKLNIDLCDNQGTVCVRMKGFSARVLDGEVGSAGATENIGTLMLEPCWKEQAVGKEATVPEYVKHLVVLCEMGEAFKESIEASRCLTLQSQQKGIDERLQAYAAQIFEEIQSILKDKPKDRVLIQIVVPAQDEQQLFSGLSGMLKTAQLESSKIIGQLIEIEDSEGIAAKLKENSTCPNDNHIRYKDGKRWVAGWSEIEAPEKVNIPWKDRGIYLITGGAGGLGLIFAKEIAHKVKNATLILTGRSPLKEDKQAQLKELQALGTRIEYKQVDVTQKDGVADLIQSIREDFGNLNGIVHCAGVIRDNFIIKKTREELQQVMAPKVSGLVNLDEASKDLDLDCFILFSSTSGAMGNLGQVDYSTANAFMDAYAMYRNSLVESKQRKGQTLSVNWPLWKEGGMHVDEEAEKMMMQSMGMIPMQTSTGIRALYQGLASGKAQVMVIEGKLTRVKQKLLSVMAPAAPQPKKAPVASPSTTVSDTGSLLDKVQVALMKAVSKLLRVKFEDVDGDTELSEYGFDSISLTEFANKLNEEYKLELTPTIFFEYSTLNSFAKYLIEEHQTVLAAQFGGQPNVEAPVQIEAETPMQAIEDEAVEIPSNKRRRSRFASTVVLPESKPDTATFEPIAIVGMSGIFPMARDVNEFWRNIAEGKDCISEIPKSRWDWREYYGDPTKDAYKTSIKWGGFIEGVDEFDPLFFEISPKEAELMDPQQRLLMSYVWKAIEDAGITQKALSQNPTGVFIAAGPGEFMNILSISQDNPTAMTAVVPSVIPNRISYALNLHGPSEYCETACSSTLVALHRAIQAIHNNECEQAIVGGINLLLSPMGFIGFEAMGYLSPEGQAKSFQLEANGFVRSEGVGAIIIKPLQKAIEDENLIYAVIRGTGVSHGGRGMSLTAPNATGMKAAMNQAYKAAEIDPRTVSYIEAHGIASPMADGIEMNALKSVYQELAAAYSPNIQAAPCYISSLKPCIGHGEVVSGMAALLKVVLAIRNKLIPGVPRFTNLNEHISLEGSPLCITAENHSWKALTDSNGKKLPRRASINSYGFGGVNAHVVVEEYIPPHEETAQTTSVIRPQIVVFSAKNPDRLQEVVIQMLEFVELQKELSLPNFAYTLQVGREAMEYRLALVVSDREELIQGLKAVKEGKAVEDIPIFTGDIEEARSGNGSLFSGKAGETLLQVFLAENNLEKLALYWAKGGKIPWESLHQGEKVRRMSLPTYPFEKRRCWVESKPESRSIVEQYRSLDKTESTTETTHSPLNERVINIVSRILGMTPTEMNLNKPLEQYGFDSIILMQLLQQLQTQVDQGVNLVRLQECRTIQDIINVIPPQDGNKPMLPRQQTNVSVPTIRPQFPELIHLNGSSQGRPVFWFHGGLGGVEMYQAIAQKSQRPFYGIQARGWMTERTPLQGIQAMASYYVHIIQSVQPEGPYDLGGYSLGGVLAYEVTRQLQELGQAVPTIVMLDSPFSTELQKGEITRQSLILQAVNLALASRIFQEPEKFAQTLIHRNEVNLNVEGDVLFKQLITLASTRGLTKTEAQLQSMIQDNIKIQRAYEFERFSILPLSNPQAVTCYYFRNKRRLLFGELEPYFSTTEDASIYDHIEYWAEWERQIPNMHIMDVDSPNHMVLLSEPNVYETIFEFCERLYSEEGVSKEFLRAFKEKTKKIHG